MSSNKSPYQVVWSVLVVAEASQYKSEERRTKTFFSTDTRFALEQFTFHAVACGSGRRVLWPGETGTKAKESQQTDKQTAGTEVVAFVETLCLSCDEHWQRVCTEHVKVTQGRIVTCRCKRATVTLNYVSETFPLLLLGRTDFRLREKTQSEKCSFFTEMLCCHTIYTSCILSVSLLCLCWSWKQRAKWAALHRVFTMVGRTLNTEWNVSCLLFFCWQFIKKLRFPPSQTPQLDVYITCEKSWL